MRAWGNFYDAGVGGADMTITTEEAARLAGIWWIQGRETMNRDLYAGTATALRSLAAERDALQARVTELDRENKIMAGLIDVIGNAFNDAGHKIFMEIGKARAALGEKE
jgi:hypothetical protein